MDFAQLQERGGGRHAANALGWIQPGELYWHPIFLHILTLLWTDMCKTLYIIKASNGENSFLFFSLLR